MEQTNNTFQPATLLRVFIDENEKLHGQPLYEAIIMKARELELAGATAIRGVFGFGVDHQIHTAKLLQLSQDLPMVVEIVDTEENINKILPFINENIIDGMVTLETIKFMKCHHS